MLEFVNVSGASAVKDKNDQNKKKVRSQAMRDFRRRQREEREGKKASLKPAPKSADGQSAKSNKKRLSVPHDRRSVSPALSGRQRATSTTSSGSVSTQVSSQRGSEKALTPRTNVLMSQKDGEGSFQAMRPPHEKTTGVDLEALKAMEHWKLGSPPTHTADDGNDLFSWLTESTTRELSPTAAQDQPAWAAENNTVFESPVQIGQMLGFCRSYIHWLSPGVNTQSAGKVLGRAWDKSQSPMLLAACCLASVGHLDAVQPGRPSGNYEVYKARVLQDIGDRMKDRDTATSEETIGALGCLLSFEMSKCSNESTTHLYGLKSLLSRQQDIPIMLKTLDLLHAVLFNSQPILTETSNEQSLASYAEDIRSDPDAASKLNPLLIVELEDFQQTGQVPYTEAAQGFAEALRNSSACIRDEILNNSKSDSASLFRSFIETCSSQNYTHYPEAPDAVHLGQCCRNTVYILSNAVVYKNPHHHSTNQCYAGNIYDAIKRVKNSTWVDLQYLRLYILLSAAAATNDGSAKSFFKAELVRSIYQMGGAEWRRMEAFVRRFLERNRILEMLVAEA